MGIAASRDPAHRVVVTGLGSVTPCGSDPQSTWEAVVNGRSGCGPLSLFDASDYSVRIAAEVSEPPLLDGVSPKEVRRMDRCIRFALAASLQAVEASGLDAEQNAERIGVAIGSGIGGGPGRPG